MVSVDAAGPDGNRVFLRGLAKLTRDWFYGEPLRTYLSASTDVPIVGSLFTKEWMVYLFSYGGLLFDLLVVPFFSGARHGSSRSWSQSGFT